MQKTLDLSHFEACNEAEFEEEANRLWQGCGVPENVLSMPIPMVARAAWCARSFFKGENVTCREEIIIRGAERPILCGLCGGFAPKAYAFVEVIVDEAYRASIKTGQRVSCFQEIPFFDGAFWKVRPFVTAENRRLIARALYKAFWEADDEQQRAYLRLLNKPNPQKTSHLSLHHIEIAESFTALGYFCGLNLENVLCEDLTALYDLSARQPRRLGELRQIGRIDNQSPQLKRPEGNGK